MANVGRRKAAGRSSGEITKNRRQPEALEFGGALTQEQIAREAYLIYLAKGAGDGHDVDDWLEAERELSLRRASEFDDRLAT